MFASFHSKGTIPSYCDNIMLNTCASCILICSTVAFMILGAIPSTSVEYNIIGKKCTSSVKLQF